MKFVLLLVAACALLIGYASAEVNVGTTANFFDLVKGELSLVKFYAPWCGHCKTLAPEFVSASEQLKGIASLIEVDCTVEKDICGKFDVQGYPTLVIFRNGEKSENYDGARTAAGISSYMKSMNGPAVSVVSTEEELSGMKKDLLPVCVVKTASVDSDMAALAKKLANSLRRKISFALVTDASVSAEDAMESITVYRSSGERETYSSSLPITVETVTHFLTVAQVDYLGELGENSFRLYMDANIDRPLGWLFVNGDVEESMAKAIAPVAKKWRQQVLMAWVNGEKYRQVTRQLALPEGVEYPALVIDIERRHYIMPLDVAITPESIDAFILSFVKGQVKNTLLSEKVPEQATVDGLTTLVGDSFPEYLSSGKDVFVLIYAPWCSHCKALLPEYAKVAKALESKDVVVGQFDGSANDVDRSLFRVDGYPSLFFIPAGKAPVVYTGGRTEADIKSYIEKHMSAPSEAASSENGDL